MSKLHFSYISATYVIECLSVANAIKAKQRREGEEDDLGDSDEVVVEGGRSSFEITQRVEFVSCNFINLANSLV